MTELSSHPAAQWAYRSAGELAQSLLKKEISALGLTDQFIARIEALDGDLNAVPVRDFARAREAAKAADASLARGERAPLLGVPVTIKESYNIAGLPTTWGTSAFKDFVAEEDALAVTRLKSAGAVILGKTNVPLSLGDWQSYNDIHGATNNPWDKTLDAGRLLGRIGGGASRWFRSFVARLRHRRLFARSGAFLRGLRAQADPRACRLPRSYAAGPARLARNGRSSRYWANGALSRRPGPVA